MADHNFFKSTHMTEQAIWRLGEVKKKSPVCVDQNYCKICGCTVTELVWSDNPCEGNCYPALMDEHEWENFKKKNKIS